MDLVCNKVITITVTSTAHNMHDNQINNSLTFKGNVTAFLNYCLV